jgi:hypothetical protein
MVITGQAIQCDFDGFAHNAPQGVLSQFRIANQIFCHRALFPL